MFEYDNFSLSISTLLIPNISSPTEKVAFIVISERYSPPTCSKAFSTFAPVYVCWINKSVSVGGIKLKVDE